MLKSKNSTNTSTRLSTYQQQEFASQLFQLVIKRIFDFTVAGILLILLAPAMFMITVAVRLTSKGGAIFTQERVGSRLRYENGKLIREVRTFKFRKFRSMRVESNDAIHRQFVQAMIMEDDDTMKRLQGDDAPSSESRYKLQNDPRITPIGRILRKTSLDELPQLWNVIIGDMSLVGPRPPIPYEVEVYSQRHMMRLNTQPGITGLWQVTARSSVSFEEMVDLDVEYIRTQSFLGDLTILIKTVSVIFNHKGAR